jgi:hypothetical protein
MLTDRGKKLETFGERSLLLKNRLLFCEYRAETELVFFHENSTFIHKINLDPHGPRLLYVNFATFPGAPSFSLSTTFKIVFFIIFLHIALPLLFSCAQAMFCF